MAEYLKVVNDDGFILIDDSFQNYHFLEKRQIDTKTLPHYSTGRGGSQLEDSNGFTLAQYVFDVTSIKKPVVAHRSGFNKDDDTICAITYTETSPNNWRIKVMFDRFFSSATGVWFKPTLYVFGLLPVNAIPTKGAVFQVRNEKNEMIFDSGRKPMNIIDFNSFIVSPKWVRYPYAPKVDPKQFPIPNYSQDRVYAIIPCSFMFDTVYQNPNFFYYTGTSSYIARDKGIVKVSPYQCGVNNIMWAQNFPTMVSYSHSFILIDVTGL